MWFDYRWWDCCERSSLRNPKHPCGRKRCTRGLQCGTLSSRNGCNRTKTCSHWGKKTVLEICIKVYNFWLWWNDILQAMTYRVGHHSTSDDSTKYRGADEIQYWKMSRNPVNRFRKWVEDNGWWSEEDESKLRSNARKQVEIPKTITFLMLGLELFNVLAIFVCVCSFCKRFRRQRSGRNNQWQSCLTMYMMLSRRT